MHPGNESPWQAPAAIDEDRPRRTEVADSCRGPLSDAGETSGLSTATGDHAHTPQAACIVV
jgi:hypothetical protein